jgi:hypothetical protein
VKQAFFVVGPESSGTRMMTQAFLSLGMYGDGGHKQRLDKEGFKDGHKMLTFRRSVPHGQGMPRIAKLVAKMERHGYMVHPIVIVRDKDMCIKSQVKNHHVASAKESRQAIRKSVEHIYREFAQAGKTPHVVYYEPFVKFKRVRTAFFKQFGLPHPKMNFYNGNKKYGS